MTYAHVTLNWQWTLSPWTWFRVFLWLNCVTLNLIQGLFYKRALFFKRFWIKFRMTRGSKSGITEGIKLYFFERFRIKSGMTNKCHPELTWAMSPWTWFRVFLTSKLYFLKDSGSSSKMTRGSSFFLPKDSELNSEWQINTVTLNWQYVTLNLIQGLSYNKTLFFNPSFPSPKDSGSSPEWQEG